MFIYFRLSSWLYWGLIGHVAKYLILYDESILISYLVHIGYKDIRTTPTILPDHNTIVMVQIKSTTLSKVSKKLKQVELDCSSVDTFVYLKIYLKQERSYWRRNDFRHSTTLWPWPCLDQFQNWNSLCLSAVYCAKFQVHPTNIQPIVLGLRW